MPLEIADPHPAAAGQGMAGRQEQRHALGEERLETEGQLG